MKKNMIGLISLAVIALAGVYAYSTFAVSDSNVDLFKQADKDGNGSLDKDEFTVWLNTTQKASNEAAKVKPKWQKDAVRICPNSGKVCDGQGSCGGQGGGCCKDKAAVPSTASETAPKTVEGTEMQSK